MEERRGFEPLDLIQVNSFQDCRNQPLCHLSRRLHSLLEPRPKSAPPPSTVIQFHPEAWAKLIDALGTLRPMDFGINRKVAMVAAASKGIGLACAQALAAEGCQISICGRDETRLTEAQSNIEGTVQTYIVDVANPDDLAWWVEQTLADLGPPEILVTNTGGPAAGSIQKITDEEWEAGFESTLMNIVRLTRLVTPHMSAAGFGRIVHITSLVAKEPSLLLPISSTLRAGICALTKIQAIEYGGAGITVNGVLPGHTLTDRQTHLAEVKSQTSGISVDEALQQSADLSPLKRMAKVEEIAAVVAFLCSTPAAYLTGESILVDGAATSVIG